MSNIPSELKYSKSHEWARVEEDGRVTVGISDSAQGLLGDLVYVDLPEVGATIHAGDESGVVESVKAASDVYSPVSGEISAVNEALADTPELVNQDPYNEGWLFKVQPDNLTELDALLDADSYADQLATEEA